MINIPDKPPPAPHLDYLDGLRALAALFVVYCHAWQAVFARPTLPPGIIGSIAYIVSFGHYAVGLFIVLSGFCLMLPVATGDGTIRGGSLRFFVRRARRILPTYYLAMAFSLAMVWLFIGQKTGTIWDAALPVTGKSVLTHLLVVHDVFGDVATINYPFWSIAVEWRIYFLFPLLVLVWRKAGPVAGAVLAIVASSLLIKLFERLLGGSLFMHYLALFANGMLAASIAYASDPLSQRLRRLPWGAITALTTAALMWISWRKTGNGEIAPEYVRDYFVGAASMSLLVMVSRSQDNWLTKLLSWRPLVFLGTFAYSIYLMHAPLLQLLWQYVFIPLQHRPVAMAVALSLIGVPLILGCSYLFYLLCEYPFTTKGKKMTTRQTSLPQTEKAS